MEREDWGAILMSIRVMTQVWEHSRQSGGGLLVMLALADFANDDGRSWPSINTVAKKARMSSRQAQRVVRDAQENGELKVELATGPNGVNTYVILLKGDAHVRGDKMTGGDKSYTQGVTPTSPKPSIEPSGAQSEPLVPSSPNPKRIDEPFILRMIEQHGPKLGDEARVREEIAAAMNHKASDKRKDKQLYVQAWLRNAMSFKTRGNGYGSSPGAVSTIEDLEAEMERHRSKV